MENITLPQYMNNALNEFDRTAQKIVDSLPEKLRSQAPPPIIYHYTNDIGLKGILETGQLWLTDIFNLNDPSELRYGCSHAVNILNNLAANGAQASKDFARRFSAFHQTGIQDAAHYFVCSFSSTGEDLGQWRAYADNGRGYAIGFDAVNLANAFMKKDGSQNPNNAVFSITYNSTVLIEVHRQIIESMFDLISLPLGKNLELSIINDYLKQLAVRLTVYVTQAALSFKHEAYENEKEFRFFEIQRADMPSHEIKRRYRSYELVKYREFDWRHPESQALKKIIVGPAANQSKARQFAKDCVAAFHKGDVEITCSKIPYRAL